MGHKEGFSALNSQEHCEGIQHLVRNVLLNINTTECILFSICSHLSGFIQESSFCSHLSGFIQDSSFCSHLSGFIQDSSFCSHLSGFIQESFFCSSRGGENPLVRGGKERERGVRKRVSVSTNCPHFLFSKDGEEGWGLMLALKKRNIDSTRH